MEARENAARAGMQPEGVVNGHFGGKTVVGHDVLLNSLDRLDSFAKRACKPDSVSSGEPPEDDHLSGMRVAAHLGATWLVGTGRPPLSRSSSGLASGGVYPSARHRDAPGALTSRFHPYPPSSGRYVSVALSFELPRQDVILHLAL